MKKLKFINTWHLLIACLLVLNISCDDETMEVDMPDQLFRPTSFIAGISANTVYFSWVPIANATYSLELSRDSLLFEKELQTISIGDVDEYTVEDLWSNSLYSARIKAVSNDSTIKDSEYKEITFITGSENTFYSVGADDIGFNSVLLKWNSAKNVDKIIVKDENGSEKTVSLLSGDVSTGKKLIEGLDEGMKYSFTIYLGEMPRGQVIATTYSQITHIEVDETQDGNWNKLGTFYFFSDAGAYVEIRNDNTVGHVMADAVKFSKEGYDDIIVDNVDDNVSMVGSWATSSSSTQRIGENYFHDGNTNKGLLSIKYSPDIPASGPWSVYMYYKEVPSRANNVPVEIFSGNK